MKDLTELLQEVNKDVKENLSEKRYLHSVGVMKKAAYLAEKYGLNVEVAKLLGIAHDIAKEMSKDEILQYVEKHHIDVDEYEAENLGLLHGKIGASICKEKYDFSENMQKAIEYHITGSPEMDDMAKVILIADKTEEGRTYIDFATVAKKEDEGIDALLLYVLDNSIEYIIAKKQKMHPGTIVTRNHFLESIKNR